MEQTREWIFRSVGLAAILTLGCAIFGSLWSGLSALGDSSGARFCQGVFWGLAVCWGLNAVAWIGLLTSYMMNLPTEKM